MSRSRLGFIARFLAILGVAYTLLALKPVDRTVVAPFTRGVAAASVVALDAIGSSATRHETMVISQGFAADIKNGCNGLEAMLLLFAAIVAFPAPWKNKFAGLVAGAVLIQILNLVRVTSLVILGRDYPHLFETFHVTVWQVVIFAATIAMFVFWSSRFAGTPRRAAA